jgi:hypothetical protein
MTTTINASTTAGLVQTADTSGSLQLQTANTAALTIDTSQNVGIGTSSPSSKLHVNGDLTVSSNSNLQWSTYSAGTSGVLWTGNGTNNTLDAYTTGSIRMRIDSSGNVLVGATSRTSVSGLSGKLYAEQSASDSVTTLYNTNATPFGLAIGYSNAPNGTSSEFLFCRDSSATRAAIRSNGGLANFSANNVNLSDERTKTDIQLADSYLDKICAIPVKTFKYKDQTDDELNLGVIAQDVDAVAPELVDHSGFGETPKGEAPYLAIYQTDLQYALMKAIQELSAKVDAQQQEINALKGLA